MNEVERLRAENQQLRRQQWALRHVGNIAVALLQNGATRKDVVQHLEDGFADAVSPVQEKAGQS